jgi:hypothetical protein
LYCYFFLPNKKIFLACFYLLLLVISWSLYIYT